MPFEPERRVAEDAARAAAGSAQIVLRRDQAYIGVMIDDKRKLAESVVGTGEAWLSELSTDELRDLVVLEMDS